MSEGRQRWIRWIQPKKGGRRKEEEEKEEEEEEEEEDIDWMDELVKLVSKKVLCPSPEYIIMFDKYR